MIMMLKLKREEIEEIRSQITLNISRLPRSKDLSIQKHNKIQVPIMDDQKSLIKTRSILENRRIIIIIRNLTMAIKKTLINTLNIIRVLTMKNMRIPKTQQSIRKRTRNTRKITMVKSQERIHMNSNSIRKSQHLSLQ